MIIKIALHLINNDILQSEIEDFLLNNEFHIYKMSSSLHKHFEKLNYYLIKDSSRLIQFKESCENIFGREVWCRLVNKKYNILKEMHKGMTHQIPNVAIIGIENIDEIIYWQKEGFRVVSNSHRYPGCDIVIKNIEEFKQIIKEKINNV